MVVVRAGPVRRVRAESELSPTGGVGHAHVADVLLYGNVTVRQFDDLGEQLLEEPRARHRVERGNASSPALYVVEHCVLLMRVERDERTREDVHRLFAHAAQPESIRVGIAWQIGVAPAVTCAAVEAVVDFSRDVSVVG